MTTLEHLATTRGEGTSTLDTIKNGRRILVLTVERNQDGRMCELVLTDAAGTPLWRYDLARNEVYNCFNASMFRSSFGGHLKMILLTYPPRATGGADRTQWILNTELVIDKEE